ncbi:MAG: hypothetical protein NTX88_00785 [Candidatus Atribacteria bacterium]|nr:hypothetical protein [Candidatus Atribacteria bacterium]
MKTKNVPFLLILVTILFCSHPVFGVNEKLPGGEVTIKTSSAEYDEQSGTIRARGESTIQWKGVTMNCPFLEFDTVKQEAKSEGDIKITWEEKTVMAKSLLYIGKENQSRMDTVNGKGKDLYFQSKKMDFFFNTGKILLTGNPLLQLRGFQLLSQQIEYSLDVKKWQASAVSIQKEGWKGKADHALYQEGMDSIVLDGNAQVEKEGNLMKGKQILVNLTTGQVKVEGNVEINIMPGGGTKN